MLAPNPLSPADLPWTVPVPMRPGGFRASAPHLRGCDRRVELGAIPCFGVGGAVEAEAGVLDIGWADLQSPILGGSPGRLGAGRAVHLGGRYLKGVGRTPLAANWLEAGDTYHNSGHMLSSAAIRELRVSEYLRAAGAGETIVGCEGLLAAELDPRLAAFFERAFSAAEAPPRPAAVDRYTQAISVKASGFVRGSNLAWLLADMGTHDCQARLPTFVRVFAAGLGGDFDEGCSCADLVGLLDAALARGVANFRRFFELGVYWGSFANNFTLDGRFLDLEVCSVFGRPTLGALLGRCGSSVGLRRADLLHFVGFELVHYLEQMRDFVGLVRDQMLALPRRSAFAGPSFRAFTAALAGALSRLLEDPGGWLGRGRWRAEVLDLLGGHLPLSRTQRDALAHLLDARIAWAEAPRELVGGSELLGLEVPRPEPAMDAALYLPGSLAPLTPADDRCAAFEDALAGPLAADSVDALLIELDVSGLEDPAPPRSSETSHGRAHG